jgi:hypothetical protein
VTKALENLRNECFPEEIKNKRRNQLMLIRPYGFGEIAPLAAPSRQKEVAHGNWLPGSAVTSGLMDFSFSALGDFSNNSCSSSKKHDRVQLKGAQPFPGQLQNHRGDQSTNETLALLQSLASSNRIQLRTCPHNMKVQYREVLHPWGQQVVPSSPTLRLNPGNVQKCCCMSLCRAPNG